MRGNGFFYFTRGRVLGIIAILVFSPCIGSAELKKIEKDTDNDGKIDRIIHVTDKGLTERFDIDTNADGVMDRFQYYENGVMVCAERDTDFDGVIDAKDFYEKEKRVRFEQLDKSGRLNQTIDFDAQERPREFRRDTTGNGLLDTVYVYVDGAMPLSTQDTNADGKVNIRVRYKNDNPVEKESDRDGDGRMKSFF